MKHKINLRSQFGNRYTANIAPLCDVRNVLNNLSVTEVVRMALAAMVTPDGRGFNDYHVLVVLNAETLALEVYGNSNAEMGIIEAAHLIPILRINHDAIMYSVADIIGDDWNTPEVEALVEEHEELTYSILRDELSDFDERLEDCVIFGMEHELKPIWDDCITELYCEVEHFEATIWADGFDAIVQDTDFVASEEPRCTHVTMRSDNTLSYSVDGASGIGCYHWKGMTWQEVVSHS